MRGAKGSKRSRLPWGSTCLNFFFFWTYGGGFTKLLFGLSGFLSNYIGFNLPQRFYELYIASVLGLGPGLRKTYGSTFIGPLVEGDSTLQNAALMLQIAQAGLQYLAQPHAVCEDAAATLRHFMEPKACLAQVDVGLFRFTSLSNIMQPQTLNPKPKTQNPKPQTQSLNPKSQNHSTGMVWPLG